jgi:hypothetical protein
LKYQIGTSKSDREKERNLRADKPAGPDYNKSAVSASEIMKELPKLSDAERRAILNKFLNHLWDIQTTLSNVSFGGPYGRQI